MTPVGAAIGWLAGAAACLMAALAVPAASAQGSRSTSGGLQGFSQGNRNEPIRIEAGNLEVRDKEKIATFSESVRVTQGEMTLECRKLIVHYTGEAGSAGATPQPASASTGGGNQQIRKLEAKGGVVMTQRDQTAVGDEAHYDAATNRMTLIGNVVLTQGQNTVRGDRLWVDMNTGVYEVKSNKGGQGRVDAVFQPGSMKENARPGGQGQPPAAAPRNGAAPATGSVPPQVSGRAQGGAADKDKSKQKSAPTPLRLN